MKMIMSLIALTLVGCVNAQVKKEVDSRNYSSQDRQDMQKYAEQYTKLISTGSMSMMTAVNDGSHSGPETVQKFYCACYKKLNEKCSKNSEGVSQENRDLWAKGNAAEVSLKSFGYSHLADKDLCN